MSWLVPSLPSIPGWSRSAPTTSHNEASPIAEDEVEDEDLDKPPMFPLPDSAQRSQAPPRSTASAAAAAPAFAVQPPSPSRSTSDEEPLSDLNIAVVPGTVPLGNMALPHSTTKRPDFGIKPGGQDVHHDGGNNDDDGGADMPKRLSPAPPKPKAKKGKVALGPGYSALDWARLTQSGKDLRGTGMGMFPLRITLDELKRHNTPEDAWSVFNGKVYNITPYLKFHPGGIDELMRVAGRDGTKLFMLTHSWVNMDFMLQECLVGMLVRG